jgi:gas vesicle protein
MGFIIGILVGAVGALLYAPKTGDITREELRVRSEELKRRADELQRIAQKIADDASVKGKELIDEARRQWDQSAAGRASSSQRTGTGGSASQTDR